MLPEIIKDLSDFTTDFKENTGNARIVSNNNIRDFIRETREIRGE